MKDKTILIGVTGSIAAYKAADLLRELQGSGADVHILMTESARRFITPLTFKMSNLDGLRLAAARERGGRGNACTAENGNSK